MHPAFGRGPALFRRMLQELSLKHLVACNEDFRPNQKLRWGCHVQIKLQLKHLHDQHKRHLELQDQTYSSSVSRRPQVKRAH
eukprot:3193943-Amphidinium_carterae.1